MEQPLHAGVCGFGCGLFQLRITQLQIPNAEISFEGLPAFRDEDYVVQWKGVVQPTKIAAGQQATLHSKQVLVTFHVYESVVDDSDSSTNFVVTEKVGFAC